VRSERSIKKPELFEEALAYKIKEPWASSTPIAEACHSSEIN
jgi:hypothetical protein